MEADELLNVIKRQPFEPVRIHVSDGAFYDVKHPDQVLISRRWVHIGVPGNNGGVFQRIHIVAYLHITRIQPLEAAGQTAE